MWSRKAVHFGIKFALKHGAPRTARLIATDTFTDERVISDLAIEEIGAKQFVEAVFEARWPQFALEVLQRQLPITGQQREELKAMIPETGLPYVARSALFWVVDFSDEQREKLEQLVVAAQNLASDIRFGFASLAMDRMNAGETCRAHMEFATQLRFSDAYGKH